MEGELASVPALPPPTTETLSVTATTSQVPQGWLHRNLRNLLALGIGSVVLYLAVMGHDLAQLALISAFGVLVGMEYAERSALKVPGKDS